MNIIFITVNQTPLFQIFIYSLISFEIIHTSKKRHIRFDIPFFIQMRLNIHSLLLHDFQIFFSICSDSNDTSTFISCNKISSNYFKCFTSNSIPIIIIMRHKLLPKQIFTFKMSQQSS